MSKRKQGPNVKKLAIRFMSLEAIPKGGGLEDGIAFLSDKKRLLQVAEKSIEEAFDAIDAVKNAPDNTYGDDDERIAGILLRYIDEATND